MSHKRPRATFEADLQAQQSPYVFFGTPLPPLDPDVRDDGSYVPVWKQEVTDERGRKRLHGAFTGGFSAGYYNTVGSKEGWTPATFVSSRSKKKKDGVAAQTPIQQKPEDFMDDEDLADAEEAKAIATKDSFSGLGTTSEDVSKRATIMDLLRASGETMGTKLLRRMGWRDGQGIGPKVRRKAHLDNDEDPPGEVGVETHLFAPENSQMIRFVRKNDHKGLGFQGEGRLSETPDKKSLENEMEDDAEERIFYMGAKQKKKKAPRGGFGVGILNDDGSGDEDPFTMGPRLSYNKAIDGDRKKNKKLEKPRSSLGNSNPLLRSKPVFISKKSGKGKETSSNGRCHDGRPPLPGFILSNNPRVVLQERKYPPPVVPPDWKPSKSSRSADHPPTSNPQSTADLARASQHDPSSRAELLGEAKLPGKSVFDFLTPAARGRIVGLTNNESLPAAGSEAPMASATSSIDPTSLIPDLDAQIAANALGRGIAGFIPYADNPDKLTRYRAFLSFRANLTAEPPSKSPTVPRDDWIKELHEFAHAATIFKPMTGMMASRFTSASSPAFPQDPNAGTPASERGISQPLLKPVDQAVEAARLGMFGPLTRSHEPFYPSRLLCKRFNVPQPATADGFAESTSTSTNTAGAAPAPSSAPPGGGIPDFSARFQSGGFQGPGAEAGGGRKKIELLGKEDMAAIRREAGLKEEQEEVEVNKAEGKEGEASKKQVLRVDPKRNEALEAERPGDAVFRAIFGSDSEDEDG